MPNYPNTTDQSAQQSTPQRPAKSSGKSNQKLYIVASVAIVVILGILVLFYSGIGGAPAQNLTPLNNATPIYMSIPQAQTLLGSQIINYTANYSASTLYNSSSPINITLLEGLVPQIAGNATNGWVTFADGSGIENASLQYIVIQTADASNISAALADLQATSFSPLPTLVNGQANGMSYTYETFSNITGSFQSLVGWKNGYVTVIDLAANNFTTNQTEMAQIASSNIQ